MSYFYGVKGEIVINLCGIQFVDIYNKLTSFGRNDQS